MQTPTCVQAAAALFSRERRRRRLAEFMASIDRTLRGPELSALPGIVTPAKPVQETMPGSTSHDS